MTTDPIDEVLLAVMADGCGDGATARRHLDVARTSARTAARRARQVVEIATLALSGGSERAAGLAFVHRAEFPEDAEVLDRILGRPAG
jgi:hypothetical protein